MKSIKVGKQIYNARSIVVLILLITLTYFELRGGRSYFDEAFTLLTMPYVIFLLICGKLSKQDGVTVLFIILVIFIGIISNMVSGIDVTIFSVCIDIIAETKFLFAFFASKYFINERTRISSVKLITPFCKVFCITAFIFGLISQVINIGMTEGTRYGIKSYSFFFPMSFQFLAIMLVVNAIISSNNSMKNKKLYYITGCISLILATKSSPLLYSVIFLFLMVYFKRKNKLKTSTVAIIVIAVVLLGMFQIQTYLMNENAPRYLFFYYGAKTATDYFPLGSGFSTFGSDQAARIYSPLYYRYGFNSLFGMNPENPAFLSDTFWPMAIGQFGWIGFILYVGVYYRIFISIGRQYSLNSEQKAFSYATFFQYMIHAVGSAILSSSAGIIGAIALGIVLDSGIKKNMRLE